MKHIIKDVNPPRRLSIFEYDTLRRILQSNFDGHEDLFRQLEGLRVKVDCETCATIEFAVDPSHSKADVKYRVPAEALGSDIDGIRIHFLIHVVDGFLHELEVFREDSEPILKMPEADSLIVF